ncbi:hypothetical protein [Holospora undulata]|uniref:hypothetical protein n=2 Tax=Holospora TaxID=44747 RepID=UPI00094ADE60|nr:hypothetical protein [Holospora undulata]
MSCCSSVFTPQVQKKLSRVYVDIIPERSGELLRSSLQRMLCSSECPQDYTLEINMETSERALEMGEDAKITLMHVVLKAFFTLKHCHKSIYQGQAVAYYYRALTPSFYGQTSTQFYISQEGAQQLAHQIFLKLGNFFSRTKKLQQNSTKSLR